MFDSEREKQIAPELLSMIEKLIARLEQINDGTYVVEDRETPRLKALIESKWLGAKNTPGPYVGPGVFC